jgi:Family of unknown function (DUF6049)
VTSRAPTRLTVLATAAMAVALCAAPAVASTTLARAHGQHVAGAPRVSVAITSISPAIAKPGITVTVSGIVVNPTAETVHSPAVQLWSSGSFLKNRTSLMRYLTVPGPTGMDSQVPGAVSAVASVAPHSTWRWSVRLPVRKVHMRAFGVYPLAVELSDMGRPLDADRTFLPFWPGKPESKVLKPVRIAWVWPLIDLPRRAACAALLSNDLAASVASGGRLNHLLAAGRTTAARRVRLTWAIDPALLSDVSVMTRPYRVGGTRACGGGEPEPASSAARQWLAGVQAATATQGFFVTPYADVDVSGLSHRGLDRELASAFTAGLLTAQQLLRPGQNSAAASAGQIAWPPHGTADYGVLERLAANHVRTVILDSTMMPAVGQVTYTPSAVTTTPDGLGSQLHVLLADNTIARILATPPGDIPGVVPAPSAWSPSSPGSTAAGLTAAAAFAKEQWFLAETAMIAAERPALQRALVVTPPRRWDPPARLASALLAQTVQAPWLQPASLSSLVGHRSLLSRVQLRPPPQHQMAAGELPASLLTRVRGLSENITLLENILNGGERDTLSKAVATIESSAWGGGKAGRHRARRLLNRVSGYVDTQLRQVQIIDPVHVTLGGKSGAVPVSVKNRLSQSITVRLEVSTPSPGRVVIGNFQHEITVEGKTLRTIKIPVRAAAAGSTTLTLRLATPSGTPLPGTATTLTVEATHFGTLAIVIILVALVVFVLTAAGRAIRRGAEPASDGADQAGEEGGEGATPTHSPTPGGEADSVVPRGSVTPTK